MYAGTMTECIVGLFQQYALFIVSRLMFCLKRLVYTHIQYCREREHKWGQSTVFEYRITENLSKI